MPPGSENFADKNLFPDLLHNSLFRNAGATSPQDQFEKALEMIRGEGLFHYDFPEGEEPVRVKAKLDGRTMLEQLAKGEIELPLKTSSLENIGQVELCHNIGFALNPDI